MNASKLSKVYALMSVWVVGVGRCITPVYNFFEVLETILQMLINFGLQTSFGKHFPRLSMAVFAIILCIIFSLLSKLLWYHLCFTDIFWFLAGCCATSTLGKSHQGKDIQDFPQKIPVGSCASSPPLLCVFPPLTFVPDIFPHCCECLQHGMVHKPFPTSKDWQGLQLA